VSATTSGETFNRSRHYFLRVSTQGQNRLTISTFLAGLTFAAFAALLTTSVPTPPIGDLGTLRWQDTLQNGDWWAGLLLSIVTILLGAATFAFLLAVVATYRALQHLADLSPSVVSQLTNPHHIDSGRAYPVIPINDQERLKDAYGIYDASADLIPRGIGALFLTLPLIALHTNWLVGVVTLGAGLILLGRRTELQTITLSTIRPTSKR